MVQWLRALAALTKYIGSIPSTHIVTTTICNFSPWVSNTLFEPSQALHKHDM